MPEWGNPVSGLRDAQDADDLLGRSPTKSAAFDRWLLLRSELFERRHRSSAHKCRAIRDYLGGLA
jgi:hypothetical protein